MLVFPAVLNMMVNLPLRQKAKLIYSINSFIVFLVKDLVSWFMRMLPLSLKVLSSLDVNKANGPDAISPRILKECAAELAPSISQLFNFSLVHGKLPSVWKSANVVPIHKSGERTLAENYRPVSLTSILAKSLERIIHKHIMKFLTHHRLLSESQHGFREARSRVTQLLQLLHS